MPHHCTEEVAEGAGELESAADMSLAAIKTGREVVRWRT